MKKTTQVNINGSIFYIDEDAYQLLNTYLTQLRRAFPGEEGKEITEDIESRISEHFNELLSQGVKVVVIEHVNQVIDTMGRPSDLADADVEEDAPGNEPPSNKKPDPVGRRAGGNTPPPYSAAGAPIRKKLYRDERNKVFGGVLSGLSQYLGWNLALMRVLFVILCCGTYFWPLFIAYIVAWMIIPAARTPQQILEMTGSPVTVGTLGQTILGTSAPNAPNQPAPAASVGAIIGKVCLSILGFLGCCIGLGALGLFLTSLCMLIIFCGWGTLGVFAELPMFAAVTSPILASTGLICLSVAIMIPCIAAIWGACCALFNARGASRTMAITVAIIEVIMIVVCTLLLNVSQIG